MRTILSILVISLVVFSACSEDAPRKSKSIKTKTTRRTAELKYSVDTVLKHSNLAFTEGLLFYKGDLYESTGSPDNLPETRSVYGTVNTETGEIDVHNELERKFFGEGMTILNDTVYQLTYQKRVGFLYHLETREQIRTFTIPSQEGWGLTNDGESLIMSDGSHQLHFIDPKSLVKTGTITVINEGRPVRFLNELEYVDGFIYANVYTTDWILKIDPSNGRVVGKLDLTDIKIQEDTTNDDALETNGIAYNPENQKFYVTGKMWNNIYVIQIFE